MAAARRLLLRKRQGRGRGQVAATRQGGEQIAAARRFALPSPPPRAWAGAGTARGLLLLLLLCLSTLQRPLDRQIL